MTCWRDLRDQLEAWQIAELEHDESFGETSDAALLFMAREHACDNLENLLGSWPPVER